MSSKRTYTPSSRVAIAFFVAGCQGPQFYKTGTVVTETLSVGDGLVYRPSRMGSDTRLLVVAHGSIGKSETAMDAARYYLGLWRQIAERQNLCLIIPAFDLRRYSAFGGYRGLWGREVSAGGQFVARYVTRHPARLQAAVICAPSLYAFPDASIAWPNGMGPTRRGLRFRDPEEFHEVAVTPDPASFASAAGLNLTVLVGDKDTETVPPREGHLGKTRIQRARDWVQVRKAFAHSRGAPSRVQLRLVPGIGHSSRRLSPVAADILFPDETSDPSEPR